MTTTLPLIGVEGGSSVSAGVTLDPDVEATATENDDVLIHVMFPVAGIEFDTIGDWSLVELVNGPTYTSAVLHVTLGAIPDLVLDWTTAGAADYTYQTVALDPLDTPEQIDSSTFITSLGGAVLPRLTNLPSANEIHMLCFAGSLNNVRTTVSVRPDVGFLATQATQNPAEAGMPVLWVGDFAGPYGDTDVTLTSAVYYDPPPSHSVGHSIALALASA